MKNKGRDIFFYLITNKAFRDWVLMPGGEDQEFWKKWIEEHPQDILDVKKAIEFVERMRFNNTNLSPSEMDAMLRNVIAGDRAGSRALEEENDVRSYGKWLRLAAAILIFLIAGIFTRELTGTKQEVTDQTEHVRWLTVVNPKGQRTTVILPDGTVVHLNYESNLKYPEKFGSDTRVVELSGEAFFQVVPNNSVPFVVRTHSVETQVLGTSFNVRSFPDEFSADISVVTGKVRVAETEGGLFREKQLLVAGDQASYNFELREMTLGKFDLESVTGWKDGLLIFKDATLEQFVYKLEKWYGVDFQIHGNLHTDWRINGRYQNEKIEDILVGLKFIYGLSYRVEGNRIILRLK